MEPAAHARQVTRWSMQRMTLSLASSLNPAVTLLVTFAVARMKRR